MEQQVAHPEAPTSIASVAESGTDALVGAANELISQVVTYQNVGIAAGIMAATWGLMELVSRFPYARKYFDSKIGQQMKEWLPMMFATLLTLMPGVLPEGLSFVWHGIIALSMGGATELVHIKWKRWFGKNKRRADD